MPSPKALQNRQIALNKIDQARALLNEACSALCDIEGRGWSGLYTATDSLSDKVKAHWHKVNDHRQPDGCAFEKLEEEDRLVWETLEGRAPANVIADFMTRMEKKYCRGFYNLV